MKIRKLGKGDHLVKLKTSPQARKSGRDWEMR
ncbi:Putative transposase (identified by ISEscan HMM) [Escherichia coli]|nr:Putative transposase (identified by ISEscan HMM) [Escherichia coli]